MWWISNRTSFVGALGDFTINPQSEDANEHIKSHIPIWMGWKVNSHHQQFVSASHFDTRLAFPWRNLFQTDRQHSKRGKREENSSDLLHENEQLVACLTELCAVYVAFKMTEMSLFVGFWISFLPHQIWTCSINSHHHVQSKMDFPSHKQHTHQHTQWFRHLAWNFYFHFRVKL